MESAISTVKVKLMFGFMMASLVFASYVSWAIEEVKQAGAVIEEGSVGGKIDISHWSIPVGVREVTSYTLGRVEETDDDPCIGAYGNNLCDLAKSGIRICASNEFSKNTKLVMGDNLECIVLDRMNARHKNRLDVADMDFEASSRFGTQKLEVAILKR